MPQAKRLIEAALSGNPALIKKAIRNVEYYMRRNHISYLSHRKKALSKLEPLSNTI